MFMIYDGRDINLARKTYIYISLLILILVIAASAVFIKTPFDQYVIKVNGEKVSLDEFKVYLKIVKKEIESQAKAQDGKNNPEDIWKVPIEGNDPMVYAREKALDAMIRLKIINQKAAAQGIKLTDQDEKLVQERMKMEEVQKDLKEFGVQEKDLEKVVRESLISSKLANNITKDANVTNQELDQYIAKSVDASKYYKVRHILFMTVDQSKGEEYSADKQKEILARANEVLKKVKAREDFSKLAKQYSEDLGSKSQGGTYEFFKGEAVPEFESAVMKLKPDETSELIKSVYGYHIIKLESAEKPTAQELDRVKKEYKDKLLDNKRTQVYEEAVSKWEKESKIEKNDSLINSIKINQL